MDMTNVSPIGWLHTLACTAALVVGAWNIAMPKGTRVHRRVGATYVAAMLVTTISTFAVYRFDIARFQPLSAGPGVFGLFHWEAVATLVFLLIAVYAAPRQSRAVWAYAHPLAMLVTYYMLLGGLINELFVRVAPLQTWARAHGGLQFGRSPVIGATQGAAMLWFLATALYFIVKVGLHRRGRRSIAHAAAE